MKLIIKETKPFCPAWDGIGLDFNYNIAIDTYQLAQRAWPNLGRWCMEDLRDLLDIQNDDAHRVLADCEDEMAVYNAIRNGVKSGELSVEPPHRRASRPGNPGNLVPTLPVVFLRYRP